MLNVWSSIPLASAAVKLPPLSTDLNCCEKAFVGNTIGQANGVAGKLLDLRFCDYTNDATNLKGKRLSAVLMPDAKFDGANMTEVTMSKAYAVGASFKGWMIHNLLHLSDSRWGVGTGKIVVHPYGWWHGWDPADGHWLVVFPPQKEEFVPM